MVTKEQLAAGLNTLRALADAIRELGEVPSGHLYATVSSAMDLPSYQKAIAMLVQTGLIRRAGDLLVWNLATAVLTS